MSITANAWPADTHILIVEDNATNLLVTRMLLAEFGLEADSAVDGMDALRIMTDCASTRPYTVVLMDCQMPNMDGFETTRRIRAGAAGDSQRAVPILAMTANVQPQEREKCLAAGMSDFIPKPIDADALEQRLRRWLIPAAVVTGPAMGLSPDGEALLQVDPTVVPVWDKDAALNMLKGRQDRLRVLLGTFLESMPARLTRLDHAVRDSDHALVESVAHSIKGSAGQLKAYQLQALAARLELAARAGDWTQMRQHYPLLQEANTRLQQYLQAYLGAN